MQRFNRTTRFGRTLLIALFCVILSNLPIDSNLLRSLPVLSENMAQALETKSAQAAPILQETPLLRNITSVAAGGSHTCALTSTGGVKCWGKNQYGQLGNGTTEDSPVPMDVSGLSSGVTAIAAGGSRTCALTTIGGVKCWGYNWRGGVGDGSTTNRITPVDVNGLTSGVIAITVGGGHACALTTGGGVKCWGYNRYGGLGDGSTVDSLIPVDVSGLSTGVSSISAGGARTCALLNSGSVKCWGYNRYGGIGDGSTIDKLTPVDVLGINEDVTAIAVGGSHVCALTTAGGVKCWGYNYYGQLGDDTWTTRATPVDVTGLSSGMIAITAGGNHTCALSQYNGIVKCWGGTGSGSRWSVSTPMNTAYFNRHVSAGSSHTCSLSYWGTVRCWGANYSGQLGTFGYIENSPTSVNVLTPHAYSALAVGTSHTCGLTTLGYVKCWGNNYNGQLGNNSFTSSETPKSVIGLYSNIISISAGEKYSCALTSGGGVKCWGTQKRSNGWFRPGSRLPQDISGLTDGVVAITSGKNHTCALTTEGRVKCWGQPGPKLGSSSYSSYTLSRPVDVGELSSVIAIAAGGYHTCALTNSGGVKCWGSNYSGQLGNGTNKGSATPVNVTGLQSGVIAITAAGSHTCALTSNHGVKCWGYNSNGQLGDGTSQARNMPTDVVGIISSVDTISAGDRHTCALTNSGEAKCWGKNNNGQLGDGSFIEQKTPVDVGGLTVGLVSISAGGAHTCGVTSNGGLLCWGFNGFGQLGDGNGRTVTRPKSVINPQGTLPPIATDDSYMALEDTVFSEGDSGVLSNDTDDGGNPLTALLVESTENGTLTLAANGSFSYQPNADFHGEDTFTYKANNGTENSNEATVSITISPVNDPPVALDGTYKSEEDTVLTIAAPGVLLNVQDVDGNSLTVSEVTPPNHGALSLQSDGSFIYTPDLDFNGTDTFTYKANDGTADSNTATITFDFDPVNDAPVTVDDAYETDEDAELTIDTPGILDNDSDADNNPLKAIQLASPSNGTLTLNQNGSFVYTPNLNFSGTDTFTYKANDETEDSDASTVSITVNPINDPPIAIVDSYSVNEDNALTVELANAVLDNDSDPEGDALTAILVSTVSYGGLSLNEDGTFSYTPNPDYSGDDSFTYIVTDGNEESDETQVNITINPQNDGPVATDDTATTYINTSIDIPLLENDADVDLDDISLAGADASTLNNGSIVVNADESVAYTPANGFTGLDTFSYTINDGNGESDIGTVTVSVQEVLPSSLIGPLLQDITKVTAGEDHTCALTDSGGVLCWGDNWAGQLGHGTPFGGRENTPKYVSGLSSGVIAIAAGQYFTCALVDPDGDGLGGVKCWGRNDNGHLGNGDTSDVGRLTPVNVAGLSSGVRAIALGQDHACALVDSDNDGLGSVKCWGDNSWSQLGNGGTNDPPATAYTPVDVVGLGNNVKAIAAGVYHTCAVTTSDVQCWGDNDVGQLGNNDETGTSQPTPVQVVGLGSEVLSIAAGHWHTCVVTNNGAANEAVKCWGSNPHRQLGFNTGGFSVRQPAEASNLSEFVVKIAGGSGHTCVITTNGAAQCWGRGDEGQLGNGRIPLPGTNSSEWAIPQDVIGLDSGVIDIAANWYHSCAVVDSDNSGSGSVRCWGQNGQSSVSRLGIVEDLDGSPAPADTLINDNLAVLAAGEFHTCGLIDIDDDGVGSVQCWGHNDSGEIGNGTRAQQVRPVEVENLGSNIKDVKSERNNVCALTTEGGVFCWGGSSTGQNGIFGAPNWQTTAVEIPQLQSGVKDIAVGGDHNCALIGSDSDDNGRVQCWGDNSNGELGTGNSGTTSNQIPQDVIGLDSRVAALAAGENETCAALNDGEIRCWGNDYNYPDTTPPTPTGTPRTIGTITGGIIALSIGEDHACALTNNNGVKCWTHNDRIISDVPGLTSGVTAIDAGEFHTCALMDTGGVKCWGDGNQGQLGIGSYSAFSETPVDVSGLTSGVNAITAGKNHTCASTTNGMKCWGSNFFGQFGNGIGTLAMYEPGFVIAPNPNHPPIAVDDFETTTNDTSIIVDALSNDSDEDGTGTLFIVNDENTGTFPYSANGGSVTVNGDNTMTYEPPFDFVGVDSVLYTVGDGDGGQDTAAVFITVNPSDPGDTPAAVATENIDADSEGTLSFNDGQTPPATTEVVVPVGAISEDLTLVYLETDAPSSSETPAGFELAGRHFMLDTYVNGEKQENSDPESDDYTFNEPVEITLSYGSIPGQNPETLTLRYWDPNANEGNGDWSTDGITCNPPDSTNQTITCTINHLTEFAIFAQPGAQTGDVNCNGSVSGIDGFFVLQRDTGGRADSTQCAVTNDTVYLPACDVNGDGNCTGFDGFLLLQCDAGIHNVFCPNSQE
ncbi:MAG: Ig-like domain-containing protein [Chloroflexota bacterium]